MGRSPTPPEEILIVPDGNEDQTATQLGNHLSGARTFFIIFSAAIITAMSGFLNGVVIIGIPTIAKELHLEGSLIL